MIYKTNKTNSVQETDGSYFESFTALAWKRENRRMSAIRAAESRAETVPDQEPGKLQQQLMQHQQDDEDDYYDNKEQLYIEVLYTIANTVGAPAPGGQVRKHSFPFLNQISFVIYDFLI